MGKPLINGTRIPVNVLLQKMAAGETQPCQVGLSLMPSKCIESSAPGFFARDIRFLPSSIIPPTGIQERKAEREKSPSLGDIVLDAEELARLLE